MTHSDISSESCSAAAHAQALDTWHVIPFCSVARIKLEGPGPKLLLSDQSTATCELLHWRIELRGNNAVEFGIVPASLQVCL
jgi:hypothetical protein